MRFLELASDVVAYGLLVGVLILVLVAPEIGNSAVVSGMIIAIIIGIALKHTEASLKHPANAMPLLGGLLILIASLLTARSWFHVVVAFLFAVLYLTGPVTAMFVRLRERMTPGLIGLLGMAGTLIGVGIAVYDYFFRGMHRAGFSVNNPIHFADIALTIGFLALAGVFSRRRWIRWASLVTPALAIVTVLLSGSRGPLVAVIPLVISMVVLAIIWRRRGAILLVLASAAVLAAFVAIVVLLNVQSVQNNIFTRLLSIIDFTHALDTATSLRLQFYQAGFHAFMASPLYGYGLIDFVRATSQFPPFNGSPILFDHLHNDLADFAVSSGILGVAAYILFIGAPIAEALRAPQGTNRRIAILLATVLTVGYAAMGATNAMLGVLSQTLLYAVGLALVAYFARTPDSRPPLA